MSVRDEELQGRKTVLRERGGGESVRVDLVEELASDDSNGCPFLKAPLRYNVYFSVGGLACTAAYNMAYLSRLYLLE